MCGLFTILNNSIYSKAYIKQLENFASPNAEETVIIKNFLPKVDICYEVLRDCGIDDANQQMTINDITLFCNGEIYNSTELMRKMGGTFNTKFSAEIIIHLYAKYGIDYVLKVIDGVFAFILIDCRLTQKCSRMYVARDQFGVRPLYILKPLPHEKNENMFAFAKNVKTLKVFEYKDSVIEDFTPGTYSVFEFPTYVLASWISIKENVRFHNIQCQNDSTCVDDDLHELRINNLQNRLIGAIEKRCANIDKPNICLLSGGLNSSIIAALLNEFCRNNGFPAIETYSIGMEGSADVRYAKHVADHLETKHTEIILKKEELIDILNESMPSILHKIEDYDIDTIEHCVGKWILCNRIAEDHSNKHVNVFCGDGLNELCGSILTHDNATVFDHDNGCDELLRECHMNELRNTVKSMDNSNICLQFPFLDDSFVRTYMSIPLEIRFYHHKMQNKKLLRMAFSPDLLPDNVLNRGNDGLFCGEARNLIREHCSNVNEESAEHVHCF